MRLSLLSVLAFMCAAAGGAPFSRNQLEGEAKEVRQHKPFENLNTSPSLNEEPALSPRHVAGNVPHTSDIQITIVNATPYRWRRLGMTSYQLRGWGKPGKEERSRWPKFIEPGESRQYRVVNSQNAWTNLDDGGEVMYEIGGTKRPMSFEIRYKMTGLKSFEVHVQFLEELATKTTEKGGRILIGSDKTTELPAAVEADRAGCSFHIAGKEGDFTSTTDWNRPDLGGWMQDLLPAIGDYPLKEIVMPRSHHAALDTTKKGYYLKGASAYAGQSVTQSVPVDQQLSAEGVRILDERVFYSKDRGFIHGHMKPNRDTGYVAGSVGRRITETIEAINDFNDANPGELIFWDFHFNTYDFTKMNAAFSLERRQEFYELLKNNLKHRAQLPPRRDDYTDLILNDFIGNSTSAVICRFNGWEGLPGPEEGFVNTNNFRVNDHWSAKYNSEGVFTDQRDHLDGSSRHGTAHGTQFLRSLGGGQMDIPSGMTLTLMARELMTWFRFQFWNILTHHKYPNWLSMDGFEGGEAKGFVIAMNKCFVARQCGDWTEKRRPMMLH